MERLSQHKDEVGKSLQISCKEKSRKYKGIFEVMIELHSLEKSRQVRQKGWSQQVEDMLVPKGTGPGVRRGESSLSACQNVRKCSLKTSRNSVKGRIRY